MMELEEQGQNLLRIGQGNFYNMEDKVYTNEEIEKEVRERVNFKLNDINDVINNHLRRCEMLITDPMHRRLEKMMRKKVFKEVKEAFIKEKDMPTPCNEMYRDRKNKQKNKTVDNIMERFERLTRGKIHGRERMQFLTMLVNNIEKAQR